MASSKDRIIVDFDGDSRISLAELSLSLLARQQSSWPQLRAGYTGLEALRQRQVATEGFVALLQCNPPRIISTGAAIDPAAIKARPCFLCLPNLPPVQQAICCYRRFLVLCNPFPIFPRHFTIAHIRHRPQALHGALPFLLRLARDFQPDFALLYNGPRSGASAPDHLHFQAVPKAAIPVLNKGREGMEKVRQGERLLIFRTTRDVRAALIVEGDAPETVSALIAKIIDVLKHVLASHGEPLLNLFCHYEDGRWRVVIFPRRKHRPDAYYKTGREQVLLSPGAVDMGGLTVVPRQEDFERLDPLLLRNIFQEVSIPEELLARIGAAL